MTAGALLSPAGDIGVLPLPDGTVTVEWTCPSPTTNPRCTLSARPVLALDLGGTQTRAAVILPDGTRLARVDDETPTDEGPAAILATCIRLLAASRAGAPSEVADGIVGIGLSSPGPVDPFAGVALEPPNLGPAFRDIPLTREVSHALELPAVLDRDTNVAALGEAAFGAGRGCDDFIYLTVSTGVGGGIVTGGRLLHGPDGLAGELGHVPVATDGPPCGCGSVGHLEAIASGVALARDARAAAADGSSPFLAARAATAGADGLSAKDVAEGEDAGDPSCTRLMTVARRAIAAACVGFVNTFNPDRLIIGGGIARAQGERLLEPVRSTIASDAFERVARRVQIRAPELGGDVSLAGAHPLVMSRLERGAHPTDRDRVPSVGGPSGRPSRATTTHPLVQPSSRAAGA